MLVEIFLPFMNKISGQYIVISQLRNGNYLLIISGITLLVGFLSGIYPSVFLASYNPVKVLYGNTTVGSKSKIFRNTLVIIQFIISVFLIISTLTIYRQVAFMNNRDLGINKDHLLVVPLRNNKMIEDYKDFKSALSSIPGLKGVTGATNYLGNYDLRRSFYFEGAPKDNHSMLLFNYVDPNFLQVMEVNLVKGRDFFEDSQLDSNAVIINKSMLYETGWQNPLGKSIYIPQTEGDDYRLKVIGVVDDFNYASLHEDVKPLLIMADNSYVRYMFIRLQEGNTDVLLNKIRKKWEDHYPDHPFEYFFQENKYDELYNTETRMVDLFIVFTILAITVAVLGLFGLVSFTTNQRAREISIRKVMGSSVSGIHSLVVKEYIIKVIIANIIAWPLAWLFLDNWLQKFAYRSGISWWVFFLGAFISFCIAVATVSFHAIKAANSNPADALKYE
jgi:putative ABC transport system permease protein